MPLLPVKYLKTVSGIIFSFFLGNVANANDNKLSPEHLKGATTVTATRVIELIQSTPSLVIIDSRMNDRPQGYIEGSVNLADIDTTCETLAQHIKTLSSPVVFYCNGPRCRRSEKAIKVAIKCGYSSIYWYRGGFEDWMNQGFPYILN